MGLAVATLTSKGIGICSCHSPSPIPQTGQIIDGVQTVNAGGLNVGKIGSIVLAGCGHTGTIVTGAKTVNAGSLAVAVLTSQFVGCFVGQIIEGSPTVNAT